MPRSPRWLLMVKETINVCSNDSVFSTFMWIEWKGRGVSKDHRAYTWYAKQQLLLRRTRTRSGKLNPLFFPCIGMNMSYQPSNLTFYKPVRTIGWLQQALACHQAIFSAAKVGVLKSSLPTSLNKSLWIDCRQTIGLEHFHSGGPNTNGGQCNIILHWIHPWTCRWCWRSILFIFCCYWNRRGRGQATRCLGDDFNRWYPRKTSDAPRWYTYPYNYSFSYIYVYVDTYIWVCVCGVIYANTKSLCCS